MDQWAGVILAAGKGERMKSATPKVLHRVCGKEMVRYPVDLLRRMGLDRIVVVVSPANDQAVREVLGDRVEYALQTRAGGTAHALACAEELLQGHAGNVVVMGADSPLLPDDGVGRLTASHLASSSRVSLLVAQTGSVGDYGRVQRDASGRVVAVVEAAGATGPHDAPGEINGGVYCFPSRWLWEHLRRIEPAGNGERYITSLVALAAAEGCDVDTVTAADPAELTGVNNRIQLAQAESLLRRRIRNQWMLDGVTMMDPDSVFIDAEVSIGRDTVLLPNTMLLGRTTVGEASEIGPGSVVRDSQVGSRCRVTASMLEEAAMEDDSDVGPFSHLRAGACLGPGVHVGNFAEIKESSLASGVMMGHFGYVGDASIGPKVNLGAGMVTCNYDGREKHRTVIEGGAFVGCDTMLVAPVTVGAGAITGAGSVVTRHVPPGRLAVGVPAKIKDRKS